MTQEKSAQSSPSWLEAMRHDLPAFIVVLPGGPAALHGYRHRLEIKGSAKSRDQSLWDPHEYCILITRTGNDVV